MTNEACPACGSRSVISRRRAAGMVCLDCSYAFTFDGSSSRRLFFSYGHDRNEPIVKRLQGDLEQAGFEVWIDREQIKVGDDWRDAILRGLVGSRFVVSFLSRHSVRDPGVCRDELAIAIGVRRGFIQTVLLEDERSVGTPASLGDVQWLDMSDWDARITGPPDEFETWYQDKLLALQSVLTSDKAVRFSGEVERARILLAPQLTTGREGALLRGEFWGRAWLAASISDWLADPAGQVLVIQGTAGTGKSAIAAHLQHDLPQIVGSFFCAWDDTSTHDPRTLIRTMAYKIALRLPDYRRLLLDSDAADDADASLTSMFERLVAEPLHFLIDSQRDPMAFIVDGLDEAQGTAANEMRAFLGAVASTLPAWLRVIVTTRPDTQIWNDFSQSQIRILDLDGEQGRADFDSYFLEMSKRHHAPLPHVTDRPCFLLLVLMANALCRQEALPSGELGTLRLGAFYHSVFERGTQTPGSEAEGAETALSLLASSPRPLGERVIRSAFATELGWEEFLDNYQDLLVHEWESFEIYWRRPTMAFVHRSVPDWLHSKEAGAHRLSRERCAETAVSFLESILDRDSWQVSTDLLDCYEETLVAHGRSVRLAAQCASERYQWIKERCRLQDNVSGRFTKVDADKSDRIIELSRLISLSGEVVRFHPLSPLHWGDEGAIGDYCSYDLFPCCETFVRSGSGWVPQILESGCACAGSRADVPSPIQLTGDALTAFWAHQVRRFRAEGMAYQEALAVDHLKHACERAGYTDSRTRALMDTR